MKRSPRNKPEDRRGAMIVFVAITLILLFIAAAFSVDVAYMHMVRAELRTATDAAARAGAEVLARTQDQNAARQAALDIAESNIVAGNTLTLDAADIEFGNVTPNGNGRLQFQLGPPLTACRVVGNRTDAAPDGPVSLFFGPMLGTNFFRPTQSATAAASVRDIALVLDVSGSMASVENGLSRLEALQAAVNVFLNEVEQSSPNSAISLTAYTTNAYRLVPLTEDFNQIRNQVGSFVPLAWTNIHQGLEFGSDSLEEDPGRRPFADRTIVLMTDGNYNVGGIPYPSADLAAGREHTIHTITFSSGADQPTMREVARRGNGIHLHADDAGDLAAAFEEIARTLSVILTE